MCAKTKILIVEHDMNDLELLQYELKKGEINYVSEIVENEKDYCNALLNFVPDIILSDYSLPAFDGPTAFKMREQLAPDTPFIFVSGNIGEENSIEYIKNGVTDYALKDKLFTLITKVKRALKESEEKQRKNKCDQELVQSEKRLARAQEIAHMGSWELDTTTNILLCSDEACRIYGLSPCNNRQSLEAWLSFIHPEDLNATLKKIKWSQGYLRNYAFYHRIVQTTGNVRYVYSESKLDYDSNGTPVLYGIVHDITEIKLAEDKIEFERNNHTSLINNTNDSMWSVDRNYKLITSNLAFVKLIKLMGGKRIDNGDDILKSDFSEEKINNFNKYYDRAFTGEIFTVVEHNRTPVEFWSEISFYPIRNGAEIIGTACHLRDITERKRAEVAVIQSEKRLKESQVIAHLGNWEFNFESNTALWSDETCRIFGLSIEEKKQSYESWELFIHPEDLEYVRAINREAQKTLGDTNINHRIILKDGTIKYINTTSKVEFDQNKKSVGLYGIIHDITLKMISDENLQQSESRLNEAEAIAMIGNWEVDMVPNTHVWSNELYKIFGINKQDTTPSAALYLSFIHPDDLNYVKEKLGETSKIHNNSSFDFRFIRNDHAHRYGYTEWKYVFDKNRVPIRIFGIVQDVTDRKLAEMERTKMVNELMQRNKDLEQFAYIVSHNLRAPVANIVGAANALGYSGLTEDEKDMLSQGLKESVTRLDNVVIDLNHVLQVKGEINEIKEIVRFSELVEDIKISIKNLISNGAIEIKHDFAEITEFLTLKSYMYSVFYNLITNSIKYRQPLVPSIIQIKSHLSKDKIGLTFTDNGMGIDLKKRSEQVFGLYKRFHLNIEGKGMGLFMVKTQVETLGGKISVKSEVNKLTEFKIEFER